jgi:hypothetical protein
MGFGENVDVNDPGSRASPCGHFTSFSNENIGKQREPSLQPSAIVHETDSALA